MADTYGPAGDSSGEDYDELGHGDADTIYVTDEILDQPWFAGKLSRADAEAKLKSGAVAGNFLVREKGDSGLMFVHTYLSLTRMMIIHNLIEFQADGSCTVDQTPWPHADTPNLEDVIDKMQEIRRKRKGSVVVEDAAPELAASLERVWTAVHKVDLKIHEARAVVLSMSEGGFLLCRDKSAGPGVYTLVVNNGDGTADQFSCPNSPLGYYLKYSELIGSSIKNLVLCILANTKGAMAAGVKVGLRVLPEDALARAMGSLGVGGGGGGGAAPALPPPRASFKGGGGGDGRPPALPPRPDGGGGEEDGGAIYHDAELDGSDEDDTYG